MAKCIVPLHIELADILSSYVKEKVFQKWWDPSIKDVASNVRLVHALIGTTNLMRVSRDDVMDAIELVHVLPKELMFMALR